MTKTSEPIGPLCAAMGQHAVIYWDWIYPIMHLFGAALMIPIIYIYLKSYIVSKLRISKSLFSIILVYFIIQFMTYVSTAIWEIYECHSLTISRPINISSHTLYLIQTYMLLGLLFYRLYKTYHGVPRYALSKFAIITFSVFYSVSCIIFITFMTVSNLFKLTHATIRGVLNAMATVCCIILSILLFGVYIYKLHLCAATSKDEELLNLVAKRSLLAIVSIIGTIINFILWAFFETFMFPIYGVVVAVSCVVDIYTNALCIFFSYKTFDGYYYKVCGYCDAKCIRKCLSNKDSDLNTTTAQTETAPV